MPAKSKAKPKPPTASEQRAEIIWWLSELVRLQYPPQFPARDWRAETKYEPPRK